MAPPANAIGQKQPSVSLASNLVPVNHTSENRPFTGAGALSAANQPVFLTRIYGLLEQHLESSSINVNWIADQLGMNRKTVYRKVQRLTRLTPTDLIRQYRLGRAVELLSIGYTVTETADLIGFKSPSHFTTVFKEYYRQTPTEFLLNRLSRP